ncbi:MAG: 2Fe-2S iron-sulfur cluster binding domain-containing protein [Desulfobulbaceae bacterium]|nr:2Fe-2S iron-sulfur cluster binding domain-containing protein [Desulfobulbaceae bacterium]
MADIITGLLIISASTAFLALLLEIADRFLADYGEKTIRINEEKEFVVKGGSTLLSTLGQNKIFLPSACGGKGTCGLCKVKVPNGGGPVLPTETPHLTVDEMMQHVRISCQLKVKEDLDVEIPEELFAIKEYRVRVERVDLLSPEMKYFHFKILAPEEGLVFKAGQYVQLEVPPSELSKEPQFRAYSIASPPYEHETMGLIITKVPGGVVSTYVHDYLQVGDELIARGPFGEFCLRESEKDMLMIATGSGLAPIRSMLHKIYREGAKRKITLFFGDKKPEDLIYYDELHEFDKTHPSFTYIPTLSRTTEEDTWDGEKGRVTDLIRKYIPDNSGIEVYICGVPAMVQSCNDLLLQKGIPQENICFDKFE